MKKSKSRFVITPKLIFFIVLFVLLVNIILIRHFTIQNQKAIGTIISYTFQEYSFDHGDNWIVEDTDDYGRRLISVHSNGIEGIIIIQANNRDKKHVYFYPDCCILTSYELFGRTIDDPTLVYKLSDIPNEVLEDFKKRNDWNLPLNDSRMHAIPYN